MPSNVIVCCILRNVEMIVPNGETTLQEHDKLLILSHPAMQDQVLDMFSRKKAAL